MRAKNKSTVERGHTSVRHRLGSGLAALGLTLAAPSFLWAQALDNPIQGAKVSGITFVGGWHCTAQTVEVMFDNPGDPAPAGIRFPAGTGTDRPDVASTCGGNANRGYGFLFNLARLGTGTHTASAFADGSMAPFSTVTFTVTTVAGQDLPNAFLTGASGSGVISDFPEPGMSTTVEWQQNLQNFAIIGSGAGGGAACPSDTMEVGSWCVDTYEASVWSDPAGSGTRFGDATDNYPCDDNGNDCDAIFAVSRSGVLPSRFITWFQAQQACLNAGKQLLPNAIWQGAAAGTPDSDTCTVNSSAPVATGNKDNCVSEWGAFDMVGNVGEWVADWMQPNGADGGSISTAQYGEDLILGVNDASPASRRFPAALIRGGDFDDATGAGVFALSAQSGPARALNSVGFRCGRPK